MNWRWTARRLLISAFLFVHVGATMLWVLPHCPLRARTIGTLSYYIIPLGLWQYWTMFAPDPARIIYTLEAEVVDAQGLRYGFAFPSLAGRSNWETMFRFRYPKYAANLSIEEMQDSRRFAARHVARTLGLTAERFPLDVHLYYQVREMSAPGSPPLDPMAPSKQSLLGNFRFETLAEVRP